MCNCQFNTSCIRFFHFTYACRCITRNIHTHKVKSQTASKGKSFLFNLSSDFGPKSFRYVISVIWCGFIYIFELYWCYLTQFWKTSCYTLSWQKTLKLFSIFSLVFFAHHIVTGHVDFSWCLFENSRLQKYLLEHWISICNKFAV